MFLRLLEFLFFFALIVLFVSQIILPSIQGKKWFPIFSKSKVELEEKIENAKEKLDEKNLQSTLSEITKNLD